MPSDASTSSSINRLPVQVFASRVRMMWAQSARYLRLARGFPVHARHQLERGGRDEGFRPQAVHGNAVFRELRRMADDAHRHAVFRHGVGGGVPEPFRVQVERRAERQNMRVGGLPEKGQRRLGRGKGAAGVDAHDQVVAPHRRRRRIGQAERAGVVDQDVDAAERLRRRFHGIAEAGVVAHVDRQGKRPAAGLFHILRRAVDRTRQFRMRLGRLGGDDDVGAVLRRPEADGVADAAGRAGDEQGLSLQSGHAALPGFGWAVGGAGIGPALQGIGPAAPRTQAEVETRADFSPTAYADGADARPSASPFQKGMRERPRGGRGSGMS